MEGTLTSGKKWASGTAKSSSTTHTFTWENPLASGYSDPRFYYFDLPKLNFTPKTIIDECYYDYSTSKKYAWGAYYYETRDNTYSIRTASYASVTNASSTDYRVALPIVNGVYRMPIGTNLYDQAGLHVVWKAFEQ